MADEISRRGFIQVSTAAGLAMPGLASGPRASGGQRHPALISPGCRKSRVRVAKLYLGKPKALWPTPGLDLEDEIRKYEVELAQLGELGDVEFVANQLITETAQIEPLVPALRAADGLLLIHLSMGISEMMNRLLALERPTVLFAAPYSGHEWASFGELLKRPEGRLLDCLLTSDCAQLAAAVRPFRAIHHLREAKILNISKRPPAEDYLAAVKERFGTEVKTMDQAPIIKAYEAVSEAQARQEADAWIKGAERVIEPDRDEIVRSCRLALACQRVLDDEQATVMTVDCYGSMYHQLPAFPCFAWVRLNNLGLGGICESDLRSALTHILFQGLSGRPGFISDPTFDEANGTVILAHCLGTTRMDGPDGDADPYLIRSIMERQEGAVIQSRMRIGQRVTQAIFVGADTLLYFTGRIADTPDSPRGCRTKIAVKPDGDLTQLWRNWSHGLHRQTCYGDITPDLRRFCRYKEVRMINEAPPAPA